MSINNCTNPMKCIAKQNTCIHQRNAPIGRYSTERSFSPLVPMPAILINYHLPVWGVMPSYIVSRILTTCFSWSTSNRAWMIYLHFHPGLQEVVPTIWLYLSIVGLKHVLLLVNNAALHSMKGIWLELSDSDIKCLFFLYIMFHIIVGEDSLNKGLVQIILFLQWKTICSWWLVLIIKFCYND